jgi:hypothetical protein
MYAFITFVSQCRSKAALCSGAALLLTACGGNVEQPAAQQSLALVATSQASGDPQPTPDTAVVGVPVDGATDEGGPSTAEELFKANREQAYGPAADQQAVPEPAPSTQQPAEAPGTPAG